MLIGLVSCGRPDRQVTVATGQRDLRLPAVDLRVA